MSEILSNLPRNTTLYDLRGLAGVELCEWSTALVIAALALTFLSVLYSAYMLCERKIRQSRLHVIAV